MALVCSRCSNIYEPAPACTRCGALTPASEADGGPVGHGPRWQQTAWGRILIGLIVSQGLFYGLRHLLTGVLLATSGGNAQELWENVQNLLLLQSLQVVGVLAGAILAGGAQRHGIVIGAVVGAWNGVFAVMLRQNPAQGLTLVGLYGQPLLHAAMGALGGWIGSRIWAPIPLAPVPVAFEPKRKKAAPKESWFAGKIHWVRVLAGAAFAVAGTLSAAIVFQKVLDLSGNKLGTTHELQDRLITWEIKALAVLVGGALAGATTTNGLKQGLFVGIATSLVLVGIQAPPTEAWFGVAFFTLVSAFSLAMAGGWFGGQLFPPVVKRHRNSEMGLPSW